MPSTPAWRDNGAIRFWQAHQPPDGYLLFSNQPDGVAFHTGHAAGPSPVRYPGPYGTVELPVESYAGTLFGPGQPVYIVWIEAAGRSYYYRPEDLSPIAHVEALYDKRGSGVYRLTPKDRPGN